MAGFRIRGEVEGLEGLRKKLAGLKAGLQNRILRPALTKAGRLLARAAKSLAPRASGLLKKSIGSKVKVYRKAVVALVGPQTGFARTVGGRKLDPVFYSHLTERGRKESVAKKGSVLSQGRGLLVFGKRARKAAGSHFLSRAWAQSKGRISELVLREAAAGFEKYAKGS